MQQTQKYRMPLYYAFTALFWGSIYAYMSFFTNYAVKIGASASFAGVIVGSYGLVQMALRVPLGVLSDRTRRRKPFVLLGTAASLIAAAGMLLFPSPVGLLIFRGFTGVAAAAWVTITVLFSSYFSPEDAPRAMGRLNTFNMLGNTTAAFVGAQLAGRFGESSAFVLAIALAGAGLVCGAFLIEKRPQNTKPIAVKELLKVGMSPTLLAVSLLALLIHIIYMGTIGSFMQPWAQSVGASTAQLGYLSIAANVPYMLSSLLGGSVLLKRMSPRAVITLGVALIAAALLAVPFTQNFPAALAAQVLQGFGNGLCLPMLMSLAILAIAPEKRGVAMGFYQSIYALGMFIGPVLSGALSDTFGLQYSFFAMSALSVLVSVMACLLLKRKT